MNYVLRYGSGLNNDYDAIDLTCTCEMTHPSTPMLTLLRSHPVAAYLLAND